MRKPVAPKLLGGQCQRKDLRFAIVCGLKLIDEVSMSSKLKTGYYHLFFFFSTKNGAVHDVFGHAGTCVNLI